MEPSSNPSPKPSSKAALAADADFCDCGRPVLMHCRNGFVDWGCAPCERRAARVVRSVDRLLLHNLATVTGIPQWFLETICRHAIHRRGDGTRQGGVSHAAYTLDLRAMARETGIAASEIDTHTRRTIWLPLAVNAPPQKGRPFYRQGRLWAWSGYQVCAESGEVLTATLLTCDWFLLDAELADGPLWFAELTP